jgi:signal transduction histidine kinase
LIFRRATFRLTLAYTVIQLGLFAVFAVGIYSFVTGTFDFDAAESDGEGAAIGAEQGFDLLRTALISFYAVLVVVIPVSSFLMARAAMSPIRESFERQQQFVDGASHEMRTPLSVIQGELELALSRSRTTGEYRAAMATSLEAVTGLTRLTDVLLKLSRTTRAELESTFESVDVAEIVHRAISRFADGGVRTTVTSPDERALARGSEELLGRAVVNLVDNAVKYGASSVEISVTTSGADGVSIGVRDDGRGMSAAEVARAFESFWRAEQSRTTPGHGLGLPLVQQIAKAHGGSVALTSQVGKGTTVVLKLRAGIR